MEWFVIGWVVIVFDYVFDYCGGVLGFLDCVLSYFGYVGYEYQIVDYEDVWMFFDGEIGFYDYFFGLVDFGFVGFFGDYFVQWVGCYVGCLNFVCVFDVVFVVVFFFDGDVFVVDCGYYCVELNFGVYFFQLLLCFEIQFWIYWW